MQFTKKNAKKRDYICMLLPLRRFLSARFLSCFLIVRLLACAVLRTFHWRRCCDRHHTNIPIVIGGRGAVPFFSCKKKGEREKERKFCYDYWCLIGSRRFFFTIIRTRSRRVQSTRIRRIILACIYMYKINRLNKWEVIRLYYNERLISNTNYPFPD